MVDEYKRLYGPVQGFVNSPEQREMNLPLDFQVRIEESGFAQQLSNRLNQRVRGSFSGVEESNQLLRTLLQEASFATPSDAVAFAETIDDMLPIRLRPFKPRRRWSVLTDDGCTTTLTHRWFPS